DLRAQQVEAARAEADHEAFLRPEDRIDGSCRGADSVRDTTNRQCAEAVAFDDPLRRVQECSGCVSVMRSRATHGASISQRCFAMCYNGTSLRNRERGVT